MASFPYPADVYGFRPNALVQVMGSASTLEDPRENDCIRQKGRRT